MQQEGTSTHLLVVENFPCIQVAQRTRQNPIYLLKQWSPYTIIQSSNNFSQRQYKCCCRVMP